MSAFAPGLVLAGTVCHATSNYTGCHATWNCIPALTAMRFKPASQFAPAREASIVFATFLGARFLAEGQFRQRIAAAALMVAGRAALAPG